MAQIVLNVMTSGLKEIMQNLGSRRFNQLIIAGTESNMKQWYERSYKQSLRHILDTGNGMKNVRGLYAMLKGTNKAFGHMGNGLTGQLRTGVLGTVPRFNVTRSREVRMALFYRYPYYAAFLHDGFTAKGFATGHPNAEVPARPFAQEAMDRTWANLLNRIETMFDGLDLSQPDLDNWVIRARW